MAKTRLISQDMVKDIISITDANEIVYKTYIELAKGNVKNPAKVNLDLGQNSDFPAYEGFFNAMPAYIGGEVDIAGLKWVSGFDGKRKASGLPYINGLIIIADPQMGTFEAVLDGTYITNVRTGAQSVSSLRALKYKAKDKISIGLLGTGEQARKQLEALSNFFEITELKIWNYRFADSTKKFLNFAKELLNIEVNFSMDVKYICDSEIIITATSANKPLIHLADINHDKNQIIITLGSNAEISNDIITNANRIITDNIKQALHRGSLMNAHETGLIDESNITTTVDKLIIGEDKLLDMNGITLVSLVGLGCLDVAIAGSITKKVIQRDIGDTFQFQPF